MNALREMSPTEKNLWTELLVDIVAGFYYFPKILLLIGSGAASGPAMAALVVKTIIVAIVAGIAIAILLHIVGQEPEKSDERDAQFSARGTLIANRALTIFICLIMGQLVIEGLLPGLAGKWDIMTNPLIISHLLLLSLLLSSFIKTVTQLFLYRRG
jgi:hypothetical protein